MGYRGRRGDKGSFLGSRFFNGEVGEFGGLLEKDSFASGLEKFLPSFGLLKGSGHKVIIT